MEEEHVPTLPLEFHVDEKFKATLLQACQTNTVYDFMLEVYDVRTVLRSYKASS